MARRATVRRVSLALAPSYAALCVAQAGLVLLPWRPWRLARSPALGVLVPLAALAAGVAAVRGAAGGADALAGLAAVVTAPLAAVCGRAWGWRAPWLGPPLAGALWVLAWQFGERLVGQAAATILVAGACATLAALIASVTPSTALAVGLVLLAALDVALVWAVPEVGPATQRLHLAAPPHVALPGGGRTHLPALQDATFGSALMGWLDLLAPALLATVLAGAGRARRRLAAAATLAAALAWGLLLSVTSPIPATVPVLAGLAVGLGARVAWPRRMPAGGPAVVSPARRGAA
jgi:hypothetical protein